MHAPYVFPPAALEYSDLFVFTTPLSFDTNEVKALTDERKEKLRVVWSTGGVEEAAKLVKQKNDTFTVGYLGTVDYCKMHPSFVKMSSELEIDNYIVIVCGGPSEKELRQESETLNSSHKFTFTGLINNVGDYLSKFDVFGYPLAPYHYGTCEQALAEAMAAGIPPVVMANPTEKLMISNNVTGLIAQNELEYGKCIKELYDNPSLRLRISVNAKAHALANYSMEAMAAKWQKIFEEAMTFKRKEKRWSGKRQGKDVSPAELFVESIGNYGDIFNRYIYTSDVKEKNLFRKEIEMIGASSSLWQASTRGTPMHYSAFFPSDTVLSEWKSFLKQ
jgi:glycosyltransferase involved in cell wall biosynthesis